MPFLVKSNFVPFPRTEVVRSAIALAVFWAMAAHSSIWAQQQDYSPSEAQRPQSIPAALAPGVDFGALPDQLDAFTQQSFARGLMPLDDALVYFALTRDARLSRLKADQLDEQLAVWAQYVQQIEQSQLLLMRFSQPAAQHWKSEFTLARFSQTRARQQMALLAEDEELVQATTTQVRAAAYQLAAQQQADFAVGWATHPEVIFAQLKYLGAQGADESSQVRYLQQASHSPAGALEPQLVAGLIQVNAALKSDRLEDVRPHLQAVHQLGHAHFSQSAQRFRQGTGSLHEMTRSFLVRGRLYQLEQLSPELRDSRSQEQFAQDWQTLRAAASGIRDTRGRMLADIAAVELVSFGLQPAASR